MLKTLADPARTLNHFDQKIGWDGDDVGVKPQHVLVPRLKVREQRVVSIPSEHSPSTRLELVAMSVETRQPLLREIVAEDDREPRVLMNLSAEDPLHLRELLHRRRQHGDRHFLLREVERAHELEVVRGAAVGPPRLTVVEHRNEEQRILLARGRFGQHPRVLDAVALSRFALAKLREQFRVLWEEAGCRLNGKRHTRVQGRLRRRVRVEHA
ncbi:hypothetical protein ON010_g10171 [Phytophthora cinnamomi]|nr:hypothetical protein ON010_g10171 [Phytophthora cinnamomi]